MKSESVAVELVDARVSTTNELKLKLAWFGNSSLRSTPASKNSPACAKLAAAPLAEDLNGQGSAGACPAAPSRAVVFTSAVPIEGVSIVPVVGIVPLFQVN